jgi:hypothetical protein
MATPQRVWVTHVTSDLPPYLGSYYCPQFSDEGTGKLNDTLYKYPKEMNEKNKRTSSQNQPSSSPKNICSEGMQVKFPGQSMAGPHFLPSKVSETRRKHTGCLRVGHTVLPITWPRGACKLLLWLQAS